MDKKTYKISTDASFDNKTKLGTYSVVVKQEGKIIKAFGKKCGIKLNNSTECEVFAVFQAMNIIDSNLFKKEQKQDFLIQTDCDGAKQFFTEDKKFNMFKNNTELYDKMKNGNRRIKEKLSINNCNFKIELISRGQNQTAHNCSYKVFKSLRENSNGNTNENIIVSKKLFLELIQQDGVKKCKVIIYLFQISDEEDLIVKTQKEIADVLKMPISTINKIFKELVASNILKKIRNGIYSMNI